MTSGKRFPLWHAACAAALVGALCWSPIASAGCTLYKPDPAFFPATYPVSEVWQYTETRRDDGSTSTATFPITWQQYLINPFGMVPTVHFQSCDGAFVAGSAAWTSAPTAPAHIATQWTYEAANGEIRITGRHRATEPPDGSYDYATLTSYSLDATTQMTYSVRTGGYQASYSGSQTRSYHNEYIAIHNGSSVATGSSSGAIPLLTVPLPSCLPSASAASPVAPASVTLAANCSGSPESVRWTQTRGTSVALSSSASATPTFTARSPGDYSFAVVATKAGGTSLPASLTVRVRSASTPLPTLNVVATIDVDDSPESISLAPDAPLAVVLNRFPERNADGSDGANFRVLDLQTRTVTRALRVGTRLASSAIAGDRAFAVDDEQGAVHVVDLRSGAQSPAIAVGGRPSDLALVSAETAAVTSGATGELNLLRMPTGTLEHRLRVGLEPRAVVLHPSGRYLYVALGGESAVAIVDAGAVPAVVVGTLRVGRNPGSIAFSPSGSRAIVTNQDANTISVLDTSLPARPVVVSTLATGVQPARGAFDPRTPDVAYVAHRASRFITVVDTRASAAAAVATRTKASASPVVLGVLNTENPSSDVRFMIGQAMMLVLEYANDARVLYVDPASPGRLEPMPETDPVLAASVLPTSRAMATNGLATAFATLINTGSTTAEDCRIALPPTVPATLRYQTTSAATNAATGSPNTPASIPPGGAQTFVFAIRPTSVFPQTDIALEFSCGPEFASPATGVNTFLLTSSAQATPDVVALAATASNDGIVRAAATGTAAFSIAAVNVGVAGPVVASVEGRGAAANGVLLSICRTSAAGTCQRPPATEVSTSFASDETATFSVFVQGTGTTVPLDANETRVVVRFSSPGGVSLGATSVALEVR